MDNLTFEKINLIIKSTRYLENKDTVLDLIKNTELKYYFLEKLPRNFDNLKEIDFILDELKNDPNPFALFDILEKSVSPENNDYILDFISKNYEKFAKSLGDQKFDRMFQKRGLTIIEKIVNTNGNQINRVLEFVTKTIEKRIYITKGFKLYDDLAQEKELLSKILLKITDKIGISKEIISLIANNFNLISDHLTHFSYASEPIYDILKNYIIKSNDFEFAFKEIVAVLMKQHLTLDDYKNKKEDKNEFEGYEWYGSGIAQGGSNFSISDRHFVGDVLRPVLDRYYLDNPGKAYDFIKSFCIWRNGKDNKIVISKDHPDFLLRASIGILLKESQKENKEAKDILFEFFGMVKGIPSKADVIFQEISKVNYGFSDEQKFEFIQKQLEAEIYHGLPANVFVLKTIISLMKNNYVPAADLFIKLMGDDRLYNNIWHAESVIVEMIGSMVGNDTNRAWEAFNAYIKTDHYKNGIGTFDAYPVSNLFNKFLSNPELYQKCIELLNDLADQEEPLTKNQQILICNGLIATKENDGPEDVDLLMKIYNDFLWPLIAVKLNKDLKQDYENKNYGLIYERFPFNNARELIVQFAERLAKNKKIKEALSIVEIFINDPDPFTPLAVDPVDPDREYDEDKRIRKGEEVRSISTVRGWCGWTLTQCSILSGRPYLRKIIELTKKLTEDENLHAASYGANALSGLAQNRLTVLPEDKNILFFGKNKKEALENAKYVESIAFAFLRRVKGLDKETQTGLSDALLHLFNPIRILNQRDAEELIINSIAQMSDEIVSKAAPLIIYFAELREDNYKDWKWQIPGLYDDLNDFDSKPLKKCIEDILGKNIDTISKSFAWHFWKLSTEEIEYEKFFPISCHYLNIIANHFNSSAFNDIFMFIEQNIEKKPTECYGLLWTAIKTEKEWVDNIAKEKNVNEINWWPHYTIGNILTKLRDFIGNSKCLDVIEFLADYPLKLRGKNIDNLSTVLYQIPPEYNKDHRIEKIFDRLIEIDPRYFDTKEKWIKESKTKK